MRIIVFTALLMPLFCFSQGKQDSLPLKFSGYILSADLSENLNVLASDAYEGRETGQKGQKMAAQYIKNFYQKLGYPGLDTLQDGFFQSYPLEVFNPQDMSISIKGKPFIQNVDFFCLPNTTGDFSFDFGEIVFCGYGIQTEVYSDYVGGGLQNKSVLIMDGEPRKKNGNSMITQSAQSSIWTTNFRTKINEAKKQGIQFLFIADSSLQQSYELFEQRVSSKRMRTDKNVGASYPVVVHISQAMANVILESSGNKIASLSDSISHTLKTVRVVLKTEIKMGIVQKKFGVSAENVCAYLEGTDLKDELLVISAHYDHLGILEGKVYNGADDDGSGTVAVMQLAKAFMEAKKQGHPVRRSILFLNFSGEEKGLLGSEYYSENPVFPLKKTVCDLNIDMIGRLDEAHAKNQDYIYLIGSNRISKELHEISEQCNKRYTHLMLDYKYNEESDPNRFYYRSDHYNFAKNGVPVIFYFNGVHSDYHRETDEVEKIIFSKIEKIAKLVFFTAWTVANRDEKLRIDTH